MDHSEKWLQWAVELQALAQAGLFYSKDIYDLERFTRIRDIAAEMVSLQSDLPLETVKSLFCDESGYQTPKLDTRAAIINDGKILLVRENSGLWSMPGGWVDVDCSVLENTVKEAREEAGAEVSADLVVAVQDREKHNLPVLAHKICKIFVLCSYLGGTFRTNSETTESAWFSPDDLPALSTDKNTEEQIRMCFRAYEDPHWKTLFD